MLLFLALINQTFFHSFRLPPLFSDVHKAKLRREKRAWINYTVFTFDLIIICAGFRRKCSQRDYWGTSRASLMKTNKTWELGSEINNFSAFLLCKLSDFPTHKFLLLLLALLPLEGLAVPSIFSPLQLYGINTLIISLSPVRLAFIFLFF